MTHYFGSIFSIDAPVSGFDFGTPPSVAIPTAAGQSTRESPDLVSRARSFNQQSLQACSSFHVSQTSSKVSSENWLDDNVSSSSNSEVESEEQQRTTARSSPDRPAQRCASQPARPAQRRVVGSPRVQHQQQQRSRSMPASNPFSPNGSRVPQPQPRFRPAGPGPKAIRNPWARTITFRPVHASLGFDARRAARCVESPPWRELAHRDATGDFDDDDDDEEGSTCCCCWW